MKKLNILDNESIASRINGAGYVFDNLTSEKKFIDKWNNILC